MQSHYSHPASPSASLPSAGSGAVADPSSHTAQMGLPRSTFQGGLPLYQPGANFGSWGSQPAPPNANGSGLAMPMYWPGFYAPSGGLPHLQPSSLLRPPPGMPIAQSIQQPLQYPGLNASLQPGSSNLPEFPPLFPLASSSQSLTSVTLPSTVAPTQASSLAPETSSPLVPNISPVTSLPATASSLMPKISPATSFPSTAPGANLPLVPPLTSSHDLLVASSQSMPSTVGSKPMTVPASILGYQAASQAMPSVVGLSISNLVEPAVSLVTPDQLLQPGPSTIPSSQPLQTNNKDEEAKQQEAKKKPSVAESSVPAPAKVKEPILPLPKPMHQKVCWHISCYAV